jgi:antitoxin component YwqK of YwqJK toxin-antitoxin module
MRLRNLKIIGLAISGILLLGRNGIYAQAKTDTSHLFLADSINAVYIYADTGTAYNKTDKQGRRQGLWEKKYADGNLRYRGHFRDNKPTGIFKNYYDLGDSLQAVRVFTDDGETNYARLFYHSGALKAEGKYINEMKDSIWKFYDTLQRMIRKDQFKNGKAEGKSVIFYPDDGNVLEIKNWKNNLEEGPFQQYFDDGALKEEGTYVQGKLQDTLTVYEPDGKITIKAVYRNDMKEGNMLYYVDGAPTDTLKYHRGKCLNCDKYLPSKKQEDSLKVHYQELQQQLDHPDSPENGGVNTDDNDQN